MFAASVCLLVSLSGAAPLLSQDPIPESEPNDSVATADTAVLGGRVSGHSDSVNDVDYWVLVGVRAGDTIYVDIDASEFHSTMVPSVHLETSDRRWLVYRDYGSGWDGEDQYFAYVAPKTDTYYVGITGQRDAGHGVGAFYTINFRRASCPVVSSEREPNNTRATARTLALNSPITALSCPSRDVDLYRLQVAHPTRINVEMFTPEQWAPALSDPRFPLAANLAVYAPDSTLLAKKQWPMSQQDSFQLSFDADEAGAYYIHAWTHLGGFRFTYTLRASETLYRGPGDPAVTFVESVSGGDIAVSATGDLYVSSGNSQILKISPSGVVTTFVSGLPARDLAFDGLGNLYATVGDHCCDPGDHALYRIAPDGQYTLLTHALGSPYGLAVAPDGSIWLGEYVPHSLRRYDPSGRLLASYPLSGVRGGGVTELAFSPAGDFYVATDAAIYRFQSGHFEEVLRDEPFIHGFAIDSAGRFYVSSQGFPIGAYGGEGRVDLYDAHGAVLTAPFARTPVMPGRIAFGRNSDGSPNRRLFFADGLLVDEYRIGEVRPGSIESPGAREPIAYQRAMRELLRPGSVLKADEREALDASGNGNGRYDIGDLRILLVRAGALR